MDKAHDGSAEGFLTRAKAEEIMNTVYPRSERARDEMSSGAGLPTPPPPPGFNATEYATAMKNAPTSTLDGVPVTPFGYANALSDLANKYATPAGVASFNKRFNRTDGAALLKQLTGKDINAPVAAAPGAAPKVDQGAAAVSILSDTARARQELEKLGIKY